MDSPFLYKAWTFSSSVNLKKQKEKGKDHCNLSFMKLKRWVSIQISEGPQPSPGGREDGCGCLSSGCHGDSSHPSSFPKESVERPCRACRQDTGPELKGTRSSQHGIWIKNPLEARGHGLAFGFVLLHWRVTPRRLSHMGGTAVEESAWVLGFPYWLPHLGPIADHLHPLQLVFLPCIFLGSISCRIGRTSYAVCKASSTGQAWNKYSLMGGIHVYIYYCCSVAKSCLILCDPMDCSMPGSSVLHYLPEFAQIHVHWVGDAI